MDQTLRALPDQSLQKIVAHFEKIYIDIKSADSALSQRICQIFPSDKIAWVSGPPLVTQGDLSAAQFNYSKKILYVKPFEGYFFKRCPGSTQKKALNCCNYYVLNLGQQCNFNCSYCYLQSYINTPYMMAYSNIEKALGELAAMAEQHGDLPYRVGTGEVIDSLSLDPLTLYSRELIEFFNQYPKWTLEFKTKSDHVKQFIDCPHAGNTVVSWSINPPSIISSEEHGTAPFHDRMRAARLCRDRGFKVAFHIDPMIWTPDWKENYSYLVDQILQDFKPDDVQVVSLGALRFQPQQRHMMRERFGLQSLVTKAEMFASAGGKLRYDTGLRQGMFEFVTSRFKQADSRWNIFLCMETPETWIAALNAQPMAVEGLKEFFRPLPKLSAAQETKMQ